MHFGKIICLAASIFLMIFVNQVYSTTAETISYQGKLLDSGGDPVNGDINFGFTLYSDSSGTSPLWSEGHFSVAVSEGIFTVILGSVTPLEPSFFDDADRWLGISVNGGPNLTPLTKLSAASYSMQTYSAEIVRQKRDLYHNIIDINPNSNTALHFISFRDSADIMLYLYGSEFQGALPEHMHSGNNAHSHDISGTIGTSSTSHTHSFSGTSASSNASHSHTASSGNYNLAHTHSGSTNSVTPTHTHTAATTSGGEHHHDFVFYGTQSGLFLFHYPEGPDHLAAHGINNQIATASVEHNQSSHGHTINVNSGGGSHSHSFSTGSWGGNHSHSVTVNSGNAAHTHSYSGTTGTNSNNHSHSFSGSALAFGDGLSLEGIGSSSLPGTIYVYVDSVQAAGPFMDSFTTAVDLAFYAPTSGDHLLEIREEGGSGGRISYNLFVE